MKGKMKTVGAYEAKTHLPQLLTRVAKGEHLTITRHGVPIVKLVPADPAPLRDLKGVIKKIREFRDHHPLKPVKGVSIQQMISEGRRF